jgi:DNA-directed RNA polymerase subunit RPC12/RpoP
MAVQRCPDCGRKMQFQGPAGTFALGDLISETDVFRCPKRHIWLRAHQPIRGGG